MWVDLCIVLVSFGIGFLLGIQFLIWVCRTTAQENAKNDE